MEIFEGRNSAMEAEIVALELELGGVLARAPAIADRLSGKKRGL